MTMRRRAATRTGPARRAVVLAVTLGLVGSTVSCTVGGPDEPVPAPTTTVDAPVRGDRDRPPHPDVPLVWPLTGVETEQVADRPAVSVKIENSPEARPQRGLVEADLVWEEVIEGGITRFVATYHSQLPDAVEPVRSIRPMDPAMVAPLDGILAFSGGQGPFIAAARRLGTQVIIMDDGDAGFRRDPARAVPHNVVGDLSSFVGQADDARTSPPPAQFAYARTLGEGTAPRAGKPTRGVDVRLSPAQRTGWTWDEGRKMFLRSEGAAASVAADGARHAARNVVVLATEVFDTKWVDPAGAPVPEHRLGGQDGRGTLFSMGHRVPVHWSKKNLKAPIALTTRGGDEALLEPGNTWIELVPEGRGSWSGG